MPRVNPITPALAELLRMQDGVATQIQLAEHGLDASAVSRRVRSGRWQRLLPGVVLTVSGTPTRRQLVIAAWIWAGIDAAVDGPDALVWHGMTLPAGPPTVHIVVPFGSPLRSVSFVRVRRAMAAIMVSGCGRIPYVDAATALIVTARNARGSAAAIAVLSRGLQLGLVDCGQLEAARERIGRKWCAPVDAALIAVGVGIRSPGESMARDLILTSRVLPEPRWNQWLDLGDGGRELCTDGLWEDAGMVNEVLGKKYHLWSEQFETTAVRRERLVAAGLVYSDCTLRRMRQSGRAWLANMERTYGRNRGRGMPAGVRLVDAPPWAARQIAG